MRRGLGGLTLTAVIAAGSTLVGGPAFADGQEAPPGQLVYAARDGAVRVASADGAFDETVAQIDPGHWDAVLAHSPRWSPNGEWIFYGHHSTATGDGSAQRPFRQVRKGERLVDPTGRSTLDLRLHERTETAPRPFEPRRFDETDAYRWRPDGTAISFQHHHGETWASGGWRASNLDQIEIDGTVRRFLDGAIDDAHQLWGHDWSPEGTRFVLAVGPMAYAGPDPAPDPPASGLYLLAADGTSAMRITSPDPTSPDANPDWSAANGSIAFDRAGSVMTIAADGTGERTVAAGTTPRWSPDGARLLFERDNALWTAHPDGSAQAKVTDATLSDRFGVWSRDGRQVAYEAYRGGEWRVAVTDLDTSTETVLTVCPAEAPTRWIGRRAVCATGSRTYRPGWPSAATWGYCEGMVTGYDDNTLRPGQPITRAQWARLAYRAAGSPDVTGLPAAPWTDTPSWIDAPARWLAANDHMTGYPDGRFRPNRPITRGQVTRATHRIHGNPPAAPPLHRRAHLARRRRRLGRPRPRRPPTGRRPSAPMTGYPDDTFRPDLDITRGQATRLACRTTAPTGTC